MTTGPDGDRDDWSPRDPRVRFLRSAASLVVLGLLGFVVVDGRGSDVTTIGTLAGVLVVLLGFSFDAWRGK